MQSEGRVFVISNFLIAAAKVLDAALSIYMWMMIISALLSWVNPDPYNPIVRFLYRATEPVLRPIRKITGLGMGIDISPMVAIMIIMFIRFFLIASLRDMAIKFG